MDDETKCMMCGKTVLPKCPFSNHEGDNFCSIDCVNAYSLDEISDKMGSIVHWLDEIDTAIRQLE